MENAYRLLNSPQSISRPHPKILIGGGGEQKTLRLVARYADACNIFGGPEQLRHKFDVLRQRCAEEGRPFEQIERTNLQSVDLGRSRRPGCRRFGAVAGRRPASSSTGRRFGPAALEPSARRPRRSGHRAGHHLTAGTPAAGIPGIFARATMRP
jgi:alkanesulfonate monooxygenase SsuD/methylene tetrahydromethanopterin reductase-like flavin-dependent oxidoreductase (luciferase family)